MKHAPAMYTGMVVCRLRSWYFLLLHATTCNVVGKLLRWRSVPADGSICF